MSGWLDPDERDSISRVAEAVVTGLAFVFVLLLLAELLLDLSPAWSRRLNLAGLAIWAIFAVDFLVRLAFADRKLRFIATNPIAFISLFIPAVRLLRAARAARAVRGVRVVRLVAGSNRGRKALQRFAAFGGAGYVGLLTLIVLTLSAAGMYSLESGAPGSTITSVGDAFWWATTTLITLGGERYPVTAEGRVLGIVVMIYGLAISGYITALLAVFLLGRSRIGAEDEIAKLRAEFTRLRQELTDSRE